MAEAGLRVAVAASLEVQLLGSVRVLGEGVSPVRGIRPAGLLAILAMNAGERVPVDEIVDAVWGEGLPNNARHGLHALVSTLRTAIGGNLVQSQRGGYRLAVETESVDALRFRGLVATTDRLASFDALRTLEDALALWRGQPLAGTPKTLVLQAVAAELDEQRLRALERRFELEISLGDAGGVVGELIGLVRTYPLRERLRGQLMVALYQTGRQADALSVYREGRDILAGELGIEPSRELKALERAILRQDESLLPHARLELVPAAAAAATEADAIALAESWAHSLMNHEKAALAAVDTAYSTIVDALETALDDRRRESALRLIGAIWPYWFVRGDQERADEWARRALALDGTASPRVEYHGLVAASELARARGDYERAARLKEAALGLAGEAGQERFVGALFADLADIWGCLGDLELAEDFAHRAIEARRQASASPLGMSHALLSLGEVRSRQRRYGDAIRLYEEAMEIVADHGLDGHVAFIRGRLLGPTLRAADEADRASATFRRALSEALALDDYGTVATATQGLAWAAIAREDFAAAARLLASVSEDAYQAPLCQAEREAYQRDVELLRKEAPPDMFQAAWQVGIASPPIRSSIRT